MKNGNYYQEKWYLLKEEVERLGGNGEKFVFAMQELYSVYNDEIFAWLAKLYDPKIGGFYYSNSARDNEFVEFEGKKYPLLPDIESTNQATNFLKGNGIIADYSELPEKMRAQMFAFVSSCLDPETGFFYHPQWQKELTDKKLSRRGRDLMWAEHMSKKFGWKYPYPTANERLAEKDTKKDSAVKIPEYFRTEEKMLEYLNSLDWAGKPYHSGNELAAQVYPIKASGLTDVVINFMNSIQHPDTGLWGDADGYTAINGYLKITCFYTEAERPIPNADKAAAAIMKCLISEEPVRTVCWQYNGWFAIANILKSLRTFGGDEGNKQADEIIKDLLILAPEAIRVTKKKVLTFRKPDFTFSNFASETSDTSQGMPVAISHSNEGDINASGICSRGTVMNIYGALELSKFAVPIFSPCAKDIFFENLRLE